MESLDSGKEGQLAESNGKDPMLWLSRTEDVARTEVGGRSMIALLTRIVEPCCLKISIHIWIDSVRSVNSCTTVRSSSIADLIKVRYSSPSGLITYADYSPKLAVSRRSPLQPYFDVVLGCCRLLLESFQRF